MRRKKKRRRLNPRLKFWAACLLLVLVILFVEHNVRNTVITFARARANWYATEAIHNAILEHVAAEITYRDLITTEKNAAQQVVFVQADLIKINRLASNAALNIKETMEELKEQDIFVPLGQALGSGYLVEHLGPKIPIRILPLGDVDIDVKDEFEEMGINQTRHRIYLSVKSDVRVVVPFISTSVLVEAQAPIADSIIVGPVPQVFWQGQGLLSSGN